MAHIATCMADADTDSYIARTASPAQPHIESFVYPAASTPTTEKQPFSWRMMHQPEGRKYQLFPKGGQALGVKSLDPEQAFALAMSQAAQKSGEKTDKSLTGGLRLRMKDHNPTRRRKVSVPELGPMTTVQEVSMDSPTIPGRPPLHERSISAPGNSWRQHAMGDMSMLSSAPLTLDEGAELRSSVIAMDRSNATPRQPLSPKQLAPLVIPPSLHSSSPRIIPHISHNRLRSTGSTPVDIPIRSARSEESPKPRTPYTPLSASTALMTPKTSTTLTTPVSAPITIESRSSPKPWDGPTVVATTPNNTTTTEVVTAPQPDETRGVIFGHRRGQSESGSIMERGRPRKRSDPRSFTFDPSSRSQSKCRRSAERRAFEELPQGVKVSEALTTISPNDLAALHKQALGQAARFEVLRIGDVEALSKELRQLDERTEYLRRTYTSLRAGRRNLHSRICQYLRSPRVARFSHDSMLKQEEALAELDSSIDDWVTKLEQAENRRTRVRQKLLEHVAAAATLPPSAATAASESLQQVMGTRPITSSKPSSPESIGVGNISTPPRSPTKSFFSWHMASGSPSPQRVVAQVPSTIFEQPVVEEPAPIGEADQKDGRVSCISDLRRSDIQSIRVYADSDVYALFADVENEITKMSETAARSNAEATTYALGDLSDEERREIYRARSHELLHGLGDSTDALEVKKEPIRYQESPRTASPVAIVDGEIILTAAVYQPPCRANTAS